VKRMDSETQTPYSAQSSSSANWTVDIWRDLYLAPGRAALAVGFSLAAVVVLIVDATDAPVTFLALARLFLILGLALAVLLFWAFYTGAVQRFEKRTGIDYNGDGMVGNDPITPAQPVVIKTELHDAAGLYGQDEQRVDNLSHLEMLVQEWANGRDFGQEEGEKLMLRADYNALRDQLINGGLAEWIGRGRTHGWKLTRRGEQIFQSIADRL